MSRLCIGRIVVISVPSPLVARLLQTARREEDKLSRKDNAMRVSNDALCGSVVVLRALTKYIAHFSFLDRAERSRSMAREKGNCHRDV